MDTQNAALSKIVLDEDLLPFIEARITDDFFPDPGHLKVWTLISDHYRTYGKPPSIDAVYSAYPTYKFHEFPEPTSYYLHQLRQDRKKVLLVQAAQEMAARLNEEEGPNIGDELEIILRSGMAQAAHEITQGRDTDFFLSGDRIKQKLHDRRANGNNLRGISTGFDVMDQLTGGLQDEQLITLVGTPKAGKSSVALKMAYHAFRNGSSPLFATFEMSTDEQEDRLTSLMTGIGLTKILNGTFDAMEEERIGKALDMRAGMAGFTITSDISTAITISGIQAKIQQYQPSFVIIDGMYLMDDEAGNDKGTPQAITSLTRGFKRLAQTLRIPIVVTTQAMLYRAKKGLTMGSIGYSSSFVQDSDIVFGVEAHESIKSVSKFHVLASRSTPKGETFIHFDWSQGKVDELTEAAYEQAVNSQTPVTGGAKKKGPPSGDLNWGSDEEDADAA